MSGRPRLLVAILVVLGLAAVAVSIAARRDSSPSTRILEIEMRASAGTFAQLFWSVDSTFRAEHSFRVTLDRTSGGFQRLRFSLPPERLIWLRFDPTDAAGEIVIGNIQLLGSRGQVLAILDPEHFRPARHVASIARQGDVVRIVTTPAGDDPILVMAFGCVDHALSWDTLWMFTPTALLLTSSAVVVLLAVCVALIGIAAFGRTESAGPLDHRRASAWLPVLWLVALFLVVLSAKLVLIYAYPITVPFWDQWEEARNLYIPYNACHLSWRHMFQLYNEHRVFFTRLLALTLLMVNGQWDPQLQVVVNAVMHAFIAVLLTAIAWLAAGRRYLDLLGLISAVTFALPFAWENTLQAFQSAFYSLLLFFVLALWLTTTYRAGTGPWYLGWLCAIAGLFTAAGGVAAPVAIAGVAAFTLLNSRREWRNASVTLAVATMLLGLGIALASSPLPQHAYLKIKTVTEFARALGRNLAWPWIEHPQWSLLMWLPIGVLLLMTGLRRGATTGLERFTLGLGIWVVLQAGAIAYGRGVGGQPPASRYQDFLSLGFVANALACIAGLDRVRGRAVARWVALTALASWLLFSLVGVERLVSGGWATLSVWRQHWTGQASTVRRFVITRDPSDITSKKPMAELPHPDPHALLKWLQDPYIRRILPASIGEPVRLEPGGVTDNTFVPGGVYRTTPLDPLARTWGSYTARGNLARGRFESKPIVPCRRGGYLKFAVAGYLGLRGQYLAVRDLDSGREREVRPRRVAGESWMPVVVPCPDGPYSVVAVDGRDDYWFAFREPVEIGWASRAVEPLIAHSWKLLAVASALALIAVRWTP